jgi:hypothetical protein
MRRLLPALLLVAALAPQAAPLSASEAETLAAPEAAPAPAAPALPPGVRQVAFGPPARSRSATGVPRCGIQAPLPAPPTFAAGTREAAWVALVDTQLVANLQGTVTGDAGGELALEPCEIYTVCGSGACRAQYGAILRRKDGQPLRPGSYRLEIDVAGKKATLPFAVAAP